MIYKFSEWFRKHTRLLIGTFAVVFILIRLPAVNFPLHQDEYKWPVIVNPANVSDVSIPHPPLGEEIYRTAGELVGFNVHFRFVPLLFGALNLLLLYYLVNLMYGRKEAVIASLIWLFSYYSILASVMVDTDGEILPFFFLLAIIGYIKMRQSSARYLWLWGGLLVLSCVLGFLVKVSFLLAIGAIAADFLWSKKDDLSKQDLAEYVGYGLLSLIGLGLVLYVSSQVFSFFDLSASLTYWEHFAVGSRDWFQTAIQCIKALLYSSPFLVCIPFLGNKELFSKSRVFIFFLVFAFIFYIVLFDFSLGALDRYLQLLILPLTVLSAATIASLLRKEDVRAREFFLLGCVIAIILALLQSLPHYVPPLHPKTEWVSRFLSLRWNFVYPFSGGSGPLGFYVSFLFIALSWILSVCGVIVALIKPQYKKVVLMFLLPLGLVYNLVFAEEYLFGIWNGSAPRLLSHAVTFIQQDSDIKMVTVYNDNGGNEIQAIGKYRKRLYVDPKFDINEKVASLNKYKEHYFVLDVPRIDPISVYQKYFDSCKVIYRETDQKMSATVYDCRNVPDVEV